MSSKKPHRSRHKKQSSRNIPEEVMLHLASLEPVEENIETTVQYLLEYLKNPEKEDAKIFSKSGLNRVAQYVQRHPFVEYWKMFVRYENLEDFIEDLNSSWQMRFRIVMAANSSGGKWNETTYAFVIEHSCNWLLELRKQYPLLWPVFQKELRKQSAVCFHEQKYPEWLQALVDRVTEEFFVENFSKGKDPINLRMFDEYSRTTTMRMALRAAMKQMNDVIPEYYTDLFPMARGLKRHFVLHVGPTNSGKTYDALNALKASGEGVYLAPLRLLAFEKYTELNEAGYPCSLLTGEERLTTKDARFQASTIEMADFEKEYACVVIDEAQMLEDESRGCRWTAAILGICAPKVHVCMAAYALSMVIRLIEECGDTYEIVEHHRNTELLPFDRDFEFPKDVENGDALIVFSRKDVHAVASQLKLEGRKASLIYGSLPYDVRQEQARLFREKSNDIVVATDAIGMGVNLPIKRVVILETQKFDGTRKRDLHAQEIQQIVGRAGRFGMYDQGFYTCIGPAESSERVRICREAVREISPLKTAFISFPETLLDIQLPVSVLLKKWDSMDKREGYITSFVMRDRALALHLEKYADEVEELDIIRDRRMIYSFASIPFNEDSVVLHDLWSATFAYFAQKHELDVDLIHDNMDFDLTSKELDYLEGCSQICDLFYQLVLKTDGGYEMLDEVMEQKRKVSDCIIEILDRHEYAGKRCKRCQAALPFDYRFGYCERCFDVVERMRKRPKNHRGYHSHQHRPSTQKKDA